MPDRIAWGIRAPIQTQWAVAISALLARVAESLRNLRKWRASQTGTLRYPRAFLNSAKRPLAHCVRPQPRFFSPKNSKIDLFGKVFVNFQDIGTSLRGNIDCALTSPGRAHLVNIQSYAASSFRHALSKAKLTFCEETNANAH